MTALAGDRPAPGRAGLLRGAGRLAALQWASLVAHPPAGRVVLAVLLATAAGAALAAIARLTAPGRAGCARGRRHRRRDLLGMVVVGLPARLLLPGHWDELAPISSRSLNGLTDVPVPYAGADAWTRLVILLAAPLMVGLAAFAAFWPTPPPGGGADLRARPAGRRSTWSRWPGPGRPPAGGGALLAILVCAWLWLPGIARGRGAAGFAVAVAAAVVAVPAAAAIDTGRGG